MATTIEEVQRPGLNQTAAKIYQQEGFVFIWVYQDGTLALSCNTRGADGEASGTAGLSLKLTPETREILAKALLADLPVGPETVAGTPDSWNGWQMIKNLYAIHHKDGNPENNEVDNLEIVRVQS